MRHPVDIHLKLHERRVSGREEQVERNLPPEWLELERMIVVAQRQSPTASLLTGLVQDVGDLLPVAKMKTLLVRNVGERDKARAERIRRVEEPVPAPV